MGQPQSKGSSGDSIISSLPEFELIKEMNHPIYGQVQIFNETKSQTQVLLKELVFNKKQAFEEKLKTIKTGSTFKHPNIIQILKHTVTDTSSKTPCISIYLENSNKDLQTELRDRMRSRIHYTENELLLIAENISSALYNLQIKGKSHGDIRPSNIFILGQKYKITNPYAEIDEHTSALERAILHNEKTFLSPQLLMNLPDQIMHHREDEFKADVFSLGVTLLAIATLTSSEDLYDYHSGTIDEMCLTERLHKVSENYSSYTYDLISSMLNLDDHSRLDWQEIQEILHPYQEEIRRRANLPFIESRHFVIREEDFLEGKSDAIEHEEKHKMAILPHGEHGAEGSNLESEVTIQKIDEQLAISKQLRENQPLIKEEGFGYSQIPTSNSILDTKIKNALKRSHDTFKHVNDYLSTYENDLKSSGYIIGQEGDKWHKKDLSDYKELLGLSPGFSDITKLSTDLVKTHHLAGEEHKEHALKSPVPQEWIAHKGGIPSYDTSYISARAQIPESNISYTTNYGLGTDILKGHEREKSFKSGFTDTHYKPSGSISYDEKILKKTPTAIEHVPIAHIDTHKSPYVSPTTHYSPPINVDLGVKNIITDIQPSQSIYIGAANQSSWQHTDFKTSTSPHSDIEEIMRKYTSKDPVLASSTIVNDNLRSPHKGITYSSTHQGVEKKTIPLVHDTHHLGSGYDSLGRRSSFTERLKEYTPKYSVSHDIEHTHKTSPTFHAALYSSSYKSPSAAYQTSVPDQIHTQHQDYYSSPVRSTGSRDQTRIEDIVAAHIQKTPGSSERKGLIEEAGSTISKYGASEAGSQHHHYESPNRFY